MGTITVKFNDDKTPGPALIRLVENLMVALITYDPDAECAITGDETDTAITYNLASAERERKPFTITGVMFARGRHGTAPHLTAPGSLNPRTGYATALCRNAIEVRVSDPAIVAAPENYRSACPRCRSKFLLLLAKQGSI